MGKARLPLCDCNAWMHLRRKLGPESRATCVQFEASLKRELESAQQGRSDFVTEFSEKDYEAIVGGWQDKLVRVAEGTQKWGLFTAVKPAA